MSDIAETPDAPEPVAKAMPESVTDSRGRVLTLRKMGALEKLRLFKACGVHASNEPYLGTAMLAFYVSAIDGTPAPVPTNDGQIEARVAKLGDEGLEAVGNALAATSAKAEAAEVLAAGE